MPRLLFVPVRSPRCELDESGATTPGPRYLLAVFGQPEADLAFRLRRRGDELPKGLEDLGQLLVMLP